MQVYTDGVAQSGIERTRFEGARGGSTPVERIAVGATLQSKGDGNGTPEASQLSATKWWGTWGKAPKILTRR